MISLLLALAINTAEAHPQTTHIRTGPPGTHSHVRVPVKRHYHRDYVHHNKNRRPTARHGGTWIWVTGYWARCNGHRHWVRGHWELRRR